MASLLSMKLKPSLNVVQNTNLARKRMLSESSLPTSSFTVAKEAKAVKLLNSANKNLGIVKKTSESKNEHNKDEGKKTSISNSLVDYGSSTDSD